MRLLLLLLTALLAAPALAATHTVKLVATRDVWVSNYPPELDTSMGRTPELKLKGNEELALLDFDTSALRGQRVVSAELWMHNVPDTLAKEKQANGVDPSRPDCLRKLGVSTVGAEWVEGEARDEYQRDPTGHGATYREASYQRQPWAYPGSQLWAVIMGNGNSLHCHGERISQPNGWWKLPVAPGLVAALANGLSHGLAVEEESGRSSEVLFNNFVHSRESGAFAPYLVVTVTPAQAAAPEPPADVQVVPAPAEAGTDYGAARLSFRAPTGAFGYEIEVNGKRLPTWQVPFAAKPGTRQDLLLEDLPADGPLDVSIRAVGEYGALSAPATATGQASPALPPPPTFTSALHCITGDPPSNAAMRIWAFPEITQIDPISTQASFEWSEPQRGMLPEPGAATLAADPTLGRSHDLSGLNAVWAAMGRRVILSAARGEIVGFQLAVETLAGPLTNVRVELTDLAGPGATFSRSQMRLYRMWYVPVDGHWYEEYALPLPGTFDLPAADNAVPGQRLQAVAIDLPIPQDLPAGLYTGAISVTADGVDQPLRAALQLTVYPVSLPDEMTFNAELNNYGPPGGGVGSEYFYAAHRLAHYHRCTLNTVPYSQNGSLPTGYAPRLDGAGAQVHIADWTKFDTGVGPLLDGSAFADNPRRGVPVKSFYLPLSEQWPLPYRQYYPIAGSPKDRAAIVRNMFDAPPIEQAFAEPYRVGFVSLTRSFAQHLAEKGWGRTDFQMYLNNKPNYGSTFWTLDEPMGRDDWQALRFWAGLFKQATTGLTGVRLRFRADISRPWWQYDQLDGLLNTIYYNNEIFDYPRFARAYNRRIPDPHVYGAANEVGRPDLETEAWCLKAYALGLNGVLPWDSLGEADSLRHPSQTALIVPGDLAGYPGPVASLRVFALRRGAQDVELLKLFAARQGWTNEQAAALVATRVPLDVAFSPRFQDEAAAVGFQQLGAQGFVDLRSHLLRELSR